MYSIVDCIACPKGEHCNDCIVGVARRVEDLRGGVENSHFDFYLHYVIRSGFFTHVVYNCTLHMSRDGGKWWSKDHHLVVIKILKNVDFSLKNVFKKW